jgi:TolB-like protein
MRKIILFTLLCCLAITDVARSYPPGNSPSNDTLEQRLDTLARKISDNLTENQKRTIAVVEFSDLKGNVTNLGRFLSEELITRLYETKKFKVIERQQLNKIIAEQKLSLTGVVDPATAQKLGRILGVDSIVFGSISDLVKNVKINARLISAETGEVFAAAAIEIAKDEVVVSMMNDGGSTTTNALPSGGTNLGPTKTSRRIESHLFTFELHGCRLSGTSVVCDFTITNNDRDRRLGIGGSTKMFDDFGNEVRPRQIEVADGGRRSNKFATLIAGVPTRARILFDGVSPTATKMTLLYVWVYEQSGNFPIEYRNVPLR